MTSSLPYLLCLLALGPGSIQDPEPGPASPFIELEDLQGTLTRLALDDLPIDDLAQRGTAFLRCEGFPTLPQAGDLDSQRAWVQLHCGARLQGRLMGGSEDSIRLALGGASQLDLSIDEVSTIRFPGRIPRGGSVQPTAPEQGDRLYLRRGVGLDRVDGLVDSFESEGVRFQGRFGMKTHPWDEVVALYIEQLDATDPVPATSPVVVDIRGGGRVAGNLEGVHTSGVVIITAAGTSLRIPLPLVREVMSADGSFQFLSDLAPQDMGPSDLFGGSAGLGMRYAAQVDRNYAGEPLRTGHRVYSRGLGVHAPSRLTWSLAGAWGQLRVRAGLDDSSLGGAYQGSVVFRIHVDGQVRWESPLVRGGEGSVDVPLIDLSGAETLTLEVDPATEQFFCDRANWLRPLLIRADEEAGR